MIEGPNILKSEVRTAIKMMRKNKAAGLDGVVIEMIEALEEYAVEKLTEIINKIYDNGKFPEDLRSPFSSHSQRNLVLLTVNNIIQ